MDLELLKTAPTKEGAGDFVLFDNKNKNNFLGQFHTSGEVAAYIKEHRLDCPFLCHLGILNFRGHIHIGNDLYV